MTIKDYIIQAFEITDAMKCNGIQVEQMYAIRQNLREAYKLAERLEEKEESMTAEATEACED